MKRLLREPLVHFLLLGALIFGIYSWMHRNARGGDSSRQVHITAAEVAWLKETWTRQWQREPTRDEMRSIVADYLREELLAREARAMGLEENDTIVRRRLAQKVEFLVQDTARLAEPTDDDLRKFFAAHPERFTTAPRISFAQIFFNRDQRKDAAGDAKAALAQLSAGSTNAASLGDRSLLDFELHDADQQSVAAQFGDEFARNIFAQPADAWHGPIVSVFGLHLVRVTELKPARQPTFAEVKEQVAETWRQERQREENERFFASLLKKYEIVVDNDVKPLIGPPTNGKEVTQ